MVNGIESKNGIKASNECERENEEANARGWQLSNCNHDTNEECSLSQTMLTNEYLRAAIEKGNEILVHRAKQMREEEKTTKQQPTNKQTKYTIFCRNLQQENE